MKFFREKAKLQKLLSVALQPGGQGRQPHCLAAWGAGRPAAGRPAPRDLCAIFSANFFSEMPQPPRCRAAGPPARQRGGRGISEKKFAEKIARRSLGASRPAAGRPALAAQLRGDRP